MAYAHRIEKWAPSVDASWSLSLSRVAIHRKATYVRILWSYSDITCVRVLYSALYITLLADNYDPCSPLAIK